MPILLTVSHSLGDQTHQIMRQPNSWGGVANWKVNFHASSSSPLDPIQTMQLSSTTQTLLHQQIAKAIVHNPHLDSRRIKVRTNRGRVVLCGSAQSFFEKQMDQEALRGIDGITSIENELEVECEWEESN